MVMQLFILGHVLLLAICALLVQSEIFDAVGGEIWDEGPRIASWLIVFAFFEAIYWGLHWYFIS